MTNISLYLAGIGFLGLAYLATLHWLFWLPLVFASAAAPKTWPSIDIIVPARNEAEVLPRTLAALLMQDYHGTWRVILVDDHSTDGTKDVAWKLAAEKNRIDRLTIV